MTCSTCFPDLGASRQRLNRVSFAVSSVCMSAQESLTKIGFAVASHDIELHESMDINSAAGFA